MHMRPAICTNQSSKTKPDSRCPTPLCGREPNQVCRQWLSLRACPSRTCPNPAYRPMAFVSRQSWVPSIYGCRRHARLLRSGALWTLRLSRFSLSRFTHDTALGSPCTAMIELSLDVEGQTKKRRRLEAYRRAPKPKREALRGA